MVLHFKHLFSEEYSNRFLCFDSSPFPLIDPNFLMNCSINVSVEKIKSAMFSISSYKAPGEDGFPAIFYQANWDVVGESVVNFIQNSWINHDLIKDINNTMIVLIPKIDPPEFINQFRPIAFFDVIYKCITKIIVNRIKPFLDSIISPFQGSFILGRNIQDNIIIAKDMMHSMSRMKGRKKSLWPLRLT